MRRRGSGAGVLEFGALSVGRVLGVGLGAVSLGCSPFQLAIFQLAGAGLGSWPSRRKTMANSALLPMASQLPSARRNLAVLVKRPR